MRIFSLSRLVIFATACLAIFSCNEKEDYSSEAITDYMPMAVGKYITYRADSLVFTSFGTVDEIHSYQVKHIVDAQITDNQGRPAYRVYRYTRDTAGLQPWRPTGSYMVTLLPDQAEVAEDNLKVIKLHAPFTAGFSWKGNKYLPDNPYDPLYNISNDNDMADWDFYYDGGPSSFTYKGRNYSNVYTVEQMNETFNVPISPGSYASKSRAVDRYAKGIGLVYHEFEIWEYQPPSSGGPHKTGFGLTMWMIDHN